MDRKFPPADHTAQLASHGLMPMARPREPSAEMSVAREQPIPPCQSPGLRHVTLKQQNTGTWEEFQKSGAKFLKGDERALVSCVLIPDDVLYAARMTAEELRRDITVLLFQKEKVTLSQPSHLAAMNRLQFQHLLASRGVPMHYDTAEFEADLKTLEMGE